MQGAREIAERVARYEKLTDLERTTLASLGIGRPEAERLNRFFQQHA